MNKKLLLALSVLFVVTTSIYILFLSKPPTDSFKALGNDYNSPKKIENYFIDTLKMSPEEAKKFADIGVSFYVTKNTTLDGIIGNLAYYGFVRDEKAFRYALEHTKDVTPSDKAIVVDSGRTIDTNAEYRISENMDAWQIADILLNRPSGHFPYDEYGYFFMP